MDPLTHALAGAAAARVALARPLAGRALLPGAVGALLPDLDALIRSSADPLLYAEYHRHFTHSLAFIPIGGLLAALPWLVRRPPREGLLFYAAATAGYATHGLLDASTTYGTVLLWPFSLQRFAFNWISIVDPLFTLLLVVAVGVSVWRGSTAPAVAGLLLALGYLGIGAVQRERALAAQARVAAVRGHPLHRAEAFPGFGSNLLWRGLYLSGDTLHFDRYRISWWGGADWRPGGAVEVLRQADLAPEIGADPRLYRDFRRFRWFSDGWLARAPDDPGVIGDARYSLSTTRFVPVWGIRFQPDRRPPTEWVDRSRTRTLNRGELRAEILGRHPAYRPLPEP